MIRASYGDPVEQTELEALLSGRVLAAIDAEARPGTPADVIARSDALRRAGFTPGEAAAILTQAALRRRARAKFGEFADRMLFTRAGLEQATRLDVAALHAARFRNAGIAVVADLGCGIGGDALAFAAAGLRVRAVERDPVTAVLAQVNLAPFPEAEVVIADAEDVDLTGVDAVWIDPARRTAGHSDTRRVGAADSSPSPDFVERTASLLPTGVKRSPAHDRGTIPDDAEAQWISDRGEVVELVLWRGGLEREGVRRAALVTGSGGIAELTAPADAVDEPVGPLRDHVYEPDGAVIRARLVGDLARATGTHPVGPGIGYLTGGGIARSPFLTAFAVDAVLPFDRQRIRKELRARGVGRLEIKKRGVDLEPAAFRRGLALQGDEEAVLIVTRTDQRRVALLCHR